MDSAARGVSGPLLGDEALVEHARRGDAAAFAALVSRYQDSIYRIARNLCSGPGDVEGVTLEVFLDAHRNLQHFHIETGFGVWLRRIAIDAIRRRCAARPAPASRETCLRDSNYGDSAICSRRHRWPELTDELIDRLELTDRVRFALQRSGEIERAAFVLREIEGLPDEQVAAILRVSPQTVR